jgi:uncharacterized BrkB/YihY/UPF0761 family membrane protein
MPSRVLATVDRYQRTHRWLGFPIAAVYKFSDDQGPYLAALITYYGFLSLFPLLLLLVTILGFALDGNPQLQANGVFGLVLGLIAWIYLLAVVTVVATEINVVASRRLWPRALLTPFTDRVTLTSADERAYTGYAGSEQRKGFEVIDVGFEPPVAQDRTEPEPVE